MRKDQTGKPRQCGPQRDDQAEGFLVELPQRIHRFPDRSDPLPIWIRMQSVSKRQTGHHPNPWERMRIFQTDLENKTSWQTDHSDQTKRSAQTQFGDRPSVRNDLGDPAFPADPSDPFGTGAGTLLSLQGDPQGVDQIEDRRNLVTHFMDQRRADPFVGQLCMRS